jgi:16S rRNA (guanine527-N7)-methyltransferase
MQLNETRVAELLKPFLEGGTKTSDSLSHAQLIRISMYIDILLHWNERINLTAVREPEEIVTRHFGESVFAARLLFPKYFTTDSLGAAVHVIDVGSGAGFPGLPIKIWAPEIRLTLIESNQKKATFLRETIRKLRLERRRCFLWARGVVFRPKGDVVTLRAVERFETILPVAAELVASQGRLAVLIGAAQASRVRELVPDVLWDAPMALPLSSQRSVIIGAKNHGG